MMERKSTSSAARTHDALVAFLKSHVGTAYPDDVGPLFGLAAVVGEGEMAGAREKRYWNDAVSAALTAEAAHDAARPSRRPAKILAKRKCRVR